MQTSTERPSTQLGARNWTPLVEAIRRKDAGSMERLYRDFQQGLRYLICRQLGAEEVEDGVQFCLTEVISAIQRGGLDDPERLPGLVTVIAKRYIAHCIGARVKSRRTESTVDDVGQHQLVGKSASPESIASLNQTRQIVRKVLVGMKAGQRAVLTRFYVLEETESRICQGLGISAQQVKNTKHQAKARFTELCQAAMHQHITTPPPPGKPGMPLAA